MIYKLPYLVIPEAINKILIQTYHIGANLLTLSVDNNSVAIECLQYVNMF
jgi:hypothetical protein